MDDDPSAIAWLRSMEQETKRSMARLNNKARKDALRRSENDISVHKWATNTLPIRGGLGGSMYDVPLDWERRSGVEDDAILGDLPLQLHVFSSIQKAIQYRFNFGSVRKRGSEGGAVRRASGGGSAASRSARRSGVTP